MQTLSSVAPPPAEEPIAEITQDITTFIPASSERDPLRMLGWVMVIGGTVALALVLIVGKLRSAPATAPAQQVALPAPLAAPAAAPQAAPAQEAPAKVEPAPATTKSPRTKRASADTAAEANPASIRVRARVAPVRATPESDAKVICSLKRGTVVRSPQQTPGGKARWFAVHCDKDSPGWVHENFVSVRR